VIHRNRNSDQFGHLKEPTMRIFRITTVAVAVAGLMGGPAQAGYIVSTSSPLTINSSPAGLNLNNGNSPGRFAFNERTAVTIAANTLPQVDTLVSGLPPGLTNAKAGPVAFLPAGVYDSHLIHLDSVNRVPPPTLTASITFSEPIVGIYFTNGRLNNSDALFGLPGVTYPTGPGASGRGLENRDGLRISADRRTLFIDDWVVSGAFDQTRVITLATPAPAGLVLAALGMPALGVVARRRKTAA
jgi:hypothetical protein